MSGEGSSGGGEWEAQPAEFQFVPRPKDLYADNEDLPKFVDWTKVVKNGKPVIMSPIRAQGEWPTCSYHAVSVCVEAACNIKGLPPLELSVQELIDCERENLTKDDTVPVDSVFKWVNRNGLSSIDEYKYTQGEPKKCEGKKVGHDKNMRKCSDNFKVEKISSEKNLLRLVAKKPVVGVIQYTPELKNWNCESPEVFHGPSIVTPKANLKNKGKDKDKATPIPTHALLIVGYGTLDRKPKTNYWIVRNSWGDTWGDGGYAKITRASSRRDGTTLFTEIGTCEA